MGNVQYEWGCGKLSLVDILPGVTGITIITRFSHVVEIVVRKTVVRKRYWTILQLIGLHSGDFSHQYPLPALV